MRLLGAVIAAVLAAAPAAALAHDTFVAPPGPLAVDGPIRLQIGSGSFPRTETPIRQGRVARVAARAGDTALAPSLEAGETALQVTLNRPARSAPHQNGVVVAVDLRPIDIDVGADEIAHYMEEIGAPPDVVAAVQAAVARDGVLRETYAKHLKLMACAALCDGLAPSRPSGSALEFVADEEAWRLLRNGRPVVGQAVFVTTEAQGRRRLDTDRQGRVMLPGDTTGPVFLSAVVLRPPSEEGGRFVSDWATLTIDVSVR